MDTECYKLTAPFVRERHKGDRNVPVCQYFEVSFAVLNKCVYNT